jgi:hypothetical protein
MASILMRALVCVFLIPTLTAASSSGTFEIDLIFPRNGTWAPADAMPIVFAIQRPDLAPSLAVDIISWTLQQRGTQNRQTGDVVLLGFEGSSNKTYFVQRAVSNTSNIEGTWYFSWEFLAGNCTSSTNPRYSSYADPSSFVYTSHGSISEFSTSRSAPSANWTSLTSAQSCGGSDGIAFAVNDVLQVSKYSGWRGFNASCAVYGPTKTTPNPCAVTIDAAAASSVSAGLKYQACLNEVDVTEIGKCPRPTMPSSGNHVLVSWPLVAIIVVISFAIL